MLDITIIREKPEWVKEQIGKLNDPAALARVDAVLELDKKRRALLTESENIQAARNKLNKGVGGLRGNKKLDDTARGALAAQAAEAIRAGDYDTATR
jgi:seryl-tRNA synthetase